MMQSHKNIRIRLTAALAEQLGGDFQAGQIVRFRRDRADIDLELSGCVILPDGRLPRLEHVPSTSIVDESVSPDDA